MPAKKSTMYPNIRTVTPSQRRTSGKAQGDYTPKPREPKKRQYCRDCDNRKRGNTWKLDHCNHFKKKCCEARGDKGGLIAVGGSGYKEKQLDNLDV